MTRSLLCEAANALMTRVQRWNWLKHWGVEIARRRGQMRARIAVARRLAVIMHRMWIDGTTFRWANAVTAEMSVA
jgi:transposase